MSFLRSCGSCFCCCCENTYQKVRQKGRESPYEMIEDPSPKQHKKNSGSKGSEQPLLDGATGEAFQSAPDLTQRQLSQDGNPPRRHSSLQPSTPTFPSTKKLYFEVDQELPEDVRSLPTLQFSLLTNVQDQSVIVNLQQALNLPTEGNKGCNPGVAIYFIPQTDRILVTTPQFNTCSPKWNQSFRFPRKPLEVLRKQTLVFRVYHRQEESRHNLIGVVMLPLAQAELFGIPVQMTIQKEGPEFSFDSTGGLYLSLNYLPDNGRLGGKVLAAHNLRKPELFQRDPYVKVVLLYKGERLFKWKTSVKKNTCIPVFQEPFNFNISDLDPRDITLDFTIMDHDKFSRDEVIGTVMVGEGVQNQGGRIHWSQMLASPNESVHHLHMISPSA